MMGKNQSVARTTLNGLAGRVGVRGPPVAHPWFKAFRTSLDLSASICTKLSDIAAHNLWEWQFWWLL